MTDEERADARADRAGVRRASRRPSTPTIRGATREPRRLDAAEPRRLAARAATRCRPCAAATSSRRCRCRATRPSGPRCWPSCASTRRSPARRSTTSPSGRACACAEGSAAVALAMAAELGARVRLGARSCGARSARLARRCGDAGRRRAGAMPRRSSARCPPARCARSRSPASATRGCASLRAQRHALAAKVVVAYEEPFWQRARAERPRRDRVAVRLHLAPGPAGCCRCWCRPSASRRSSPRRPRRARQTVLDGLERAVRRARPGARSRCSSGPGGATRTRSGYIASLGAG